jgi:SpoIID/LytB domain protein
MIRKEPQISVGILLGSEINFSLNERFLLEPNGVPFEKLHKVTIHKDQMWLDGEWVDDEKLVFNPVRFRESSFELKEVIIGLGFHWERKENQTFKGSLEIRIEGDKLRAINRIPLEDYLVSVISSEMKATSSIELLKAHAVISRSWLMAQITKSSELSQSTVAYQSIIETADEYIRWYDREDHVGFDVCADDHCQRYQGITRQSTPIVEQAVAATRGNFLIYEGKICDARFSKCCGGISENFEQVWEPEFHPYLQSVIDNPDVPEGFETDFSHEDAAGKWIRNKPDAFCNTNDKKVLSQVLNDYDQETSDFYRWKIIYKQAELAGLIARKSGIDFGDIVDLIPVERGRSGRIIKLKIIGTNRTLVVGKELEIRKLLSESHLYSSAFVVEKLNVINGIPGEFVLSGAGWGHGVGLCQIGAAVMSEKGYTYDQILLHYFSGASVSKEY